MGVEVGQPAPLFTLPDAENKLRSLQEFIGKRNIVLAFYFGDFTSVCTKEMCLFRDDPKKFESLDAQVLGISVDTPFSHKAFAQQNNITFPLLSDFNRIATKMYDVLHDEIFGLKQIAKRSVFIIDKKGIVRYKWISEDPRNEPNYDEITQVLGKIETK